MRTILQFFRAHSKVYVSLNNVLNEKKKGETMKEGISRIKTQI